jgi:hypothetical protein
VFASAVETVVPFRTPPEKVALATHFRSTWLTASLDGLKAKGHYARYIELLPARFHDPILHSIAGVWLPIDIAVAHYAACDALGLTQAEQLDMGREVLTRLKKTIFSLAFRAARDIGVTPWTMLKLLPGQFEREVRGGRAASFDSAPRTLGSSSSAFRSARARTRAPGCAASRTDCANRFVRRSIARSYATSRDLRRSPIASPGRRRAAPRHVTCAFTVLRSSPVRRATSSYEGCRA